ncbi:MAG: deoxyhypusine synthase family protein, partial [Terriglobia bacterium]
LNRRMFLSGRGPRRGHSGSLRGSASVENSSSSDLLRQLALTGFQGRRLGEAFENWKRMLQAPLTTIFFGLSGAMSPGVMSPFLRFLVERRAIDVIVSTGANLSHDVYLGLGGKHYLGNDQVDDARLRREGFHRIYDVFESGDVMDEVEDWITSLVRRSLVDGRAYSSREITRLIGKELSSTKLGRQTLLGCAYAVGVPVFIPALGDSVLGSAMMLANREFGRRIVVDMMMDLEEITSISAASPRAGAVFIGGGVPKNYIQQSSVIATYLCGRDKSFDFGLQITTDSPQWGGLSGSTFSEAISWGKYKKDAAFATCYVDATIALPLLTSALDRWKPLNSRIRPIFRWNQDGLKVRFLRGGHLSNVR